MDNIYNKAYLDGRQAFKDEVVVHPRDLTTWERMCWEAGWADECKGLPIPEGVVT